LLLHPRLVCVNPRFITSNVSEDEVGVVLGLFLKLMADGNKLFLLFIA
jgi:hypothetical protein